MDNGQLIIDNGQLPHVEHVETKDNGINNNHRNVNGEALNEVKHRNVKHRNTETALAIETQKRET